MNEAQTRLNKIDPKIVSCMMCASFPSELTR